MNQQDNLIPHRCNRCGGRWFTEHDSHGSYLDCMCCGNQYPLTQESGVYTGAAQTASYHGNSADRVSWSGYPVMEVF